MKVCLHVYVRHARMYACMCMYEGMHGGMHVCVYTYTEGKQVCMQAYICVYVHIGPVSIHVMMVVMMNDMYVF